MTILIVDGLNFMHRARSGWTRGDNPVVYNFFRQLKAQIAQHNPSHVILTLEGHPKKRMQLLPEYKANRLVDRTTKEGNDKHQSLVDFFRQVNIIVDVLMRFPISVVRHPDHEADDLIHNIIKNAPNEDDFVVVSTDTDFIQLLQCFSNVQLYNPVTKQFVIAPDYDYIYWKSLRGDGSDNIPALPGVTDLVATKLMSDPDSLQLVLLKHGETFQRNVDLIRFIDFDFDEFGLIESSSPRKDWDAVKSIFLQFAFNSMLKESYWDKFQSTFDNMW